MENKLPDIPATTPVIQNPPKQKNTFLILIIFILVIALSITGTLLYIFYKNKQTVISNTNPSPVTAQQTNLNTDWKTYTDEKAGFSLQYPTNVLLNGEGKGTTQMILNVGRELIDNITDQPMIGGKAEALKDEEALKNGQIENAGFASDAFIKKIGDTNIKITTNLAAFEECSVIISKSITFYSNNYRVRIGLSGVKEQVVTDNPEFFIDNPTCGAKAWDLKNGSPEKFITALKAGQLKGTGKAWSDTFDAILATVKINQVATINKVLSTPSPQNVAGCNFSDTTFCPILENIKASLDTKNTQPIYSYLIPQSVTCDPDGMFVPICENMPKGTVKEGLMLGYVQSEGAIYPESQAINIVESYITSNNVTYHGVKQQGDKGVIVYLSGDKLKVLVFPFKKVDSKWKMNFILMGTATDNYKNLDDSIINF